MVAAPFRHETSRNLSPQIHTHCIIANMTHGQNNQWQNVKPTMLAGERGFAVDNDDEIYYIGEETRAAGEEYELTVRSYDGPNSDDITQDYVSVVPVEDASMEVKLDVM